MVSISFLLHGKLDAAVKPIEMMQEQLEFLGDVWSYDKSFIDISEPHGRLEVC